MSIIKTHDITLTGNVSNHKIVLHPLSDGHLPLLYKWNADPDVLYWSEGDDVTAYDAETVHGIYGKTSQTAFCFLIEVDNIPVGECWLQKMNIKTILEKYATNADVRRIDIMIGEKDYWNRGIGSAVIGMLVDFAFNYQGVGFLHALVSDFNKRSLRAFEKNGFALFSQEQGELYLRITKQEMQKTVSIKFCEISDVDDSLFKYAVIVSRYNGKWVFCKNKTRKWELPGGGREEGESILDNAKRELFEETGATIFDIKPICAYSINSYGTLFFAEIKEFGPLPKFEIEEIGFFDEPPAELSFPEYHTVLFDKAKADIMG